MINFNFYKISKLIFVNSINDYLNANTSHSIKTICVLLDDSRNDKECFKNYYYLD